MRFFFILLAKEIRISINYGIDQLMANFIDFFLINKMLLLILCGFNLML